MKLSGLKFAELFEWCVAQSEHGVTVGAGHADGAVAPGGVGRRLGEGVNLAGEEAAVVLPRPESRISKDVSTDRKGRLEHCAWQSFGGKPIPLLK